MHSAGEVSVERLFADFIFTPHVHVQGPNANAATLKVSMSQPTETAVDEWFLLVACCAKWARDC